MYLYHDQVPLEEWEKRARRDGLYAVFFNSLDIRRMCAPESYATAADF